MCNHQWCHQISNTCGSKNPNLPPAGPQFATLMQTLEFGLNNSDSAVAGDSLEALASLAQFHCKSVSAGGPGLAAHPASGIDTSINTDVLLPVADTSNSGCTLDADHTLSILA